MDDSRTRNAVRNIYWGTIEKLIMTAGPFVIRTLLIQYLGSEYLGLNGLYNSILQVLSLAELGVGSAMTYSMYKPIAEKDTKTISALLALYRKIYTIIGCVILTAGLLCMPFLPKLISGSYPTDVNLYLLFIIYLVNTVCSYWLFAYLECLLIASQRNDIQKRVTTSITMAMYIIQIMLIILFRNYYLYAIVIPLSTVTNNLFKYRIIHKRFPNIKCEGKLDKRQTNDIFKRVYSLTLSKICNVCRNSFDSIILSAFLGLIVVAKYQNYYYIINMIFGFLNVINIAIVPSVGNSLVTESREKNYMNFIKIANAFNWIISWCTVCLLCLYQPFIEIWVGKEYLFSIHMVILFCIYFYVLCIGNVSDIFKTAAGAWWEDRYRPIIEAVVNLSLNILVVKHYGASGVLVSTIVSIAFINIPWIAHILYKYVFEQNVSAYWRLLLRNVLMTGAGCTVTYYICCRLTSSFNVYWTFGVRIIICCIIPNVLFLLHSLITSTYADVKDVFFRLLKKEK